MDAAGSAIDSARHGHGAHRRASRWHARRRPSDTELDPDVGAAIGRRRRIAARRKVEVVELSRARAAVELRRRAQSPTRRHLCGTKAQYPRGAPTATSSVLAGAGHGVVVPLRHRRSSFIEDVRSARRRRRHEPHRPERARKPARRTHLSTCRRRSSSRSRFSITTTSTSPSELSSKAFPAAPRGPRAPTAPPSARDPPRDDRQVLRRDESRLAQRSSPRARKELISMRGGRTTPRA